MKQIIIISISLIVGFLSGFALQTYALELTPPIISSQNITMTQEATQTNATCQPSTKTAGQSEMTKTAVVPKSKQYYTEEEVEMVAKVLYQECRGIPSDTEKACVAWVICNRLDAGYASTLRDVIIAPNQFAYDTQTPITAELYALAKDVLSRWNAEKNGAAAVGRVLPADYLWFAGDGQRNHFRNAFQGGSRWDYRLDSPYQD